MRRALLTILVLLVAPAWLCGAEEGVVIDGVAAYVNQRVITIGEALAVMEPVKRELQRRYAGKELRKQLEQAYADALNALIEKQLVFDAYEQQDMKLPEWAVDERINQLIQDLFKGDRTALMEALAKDNLTYDEWRISVQEQMAATSMRNANVDAAVSVSPGDVRRYYREHADEFQSASAVKLRMIVLDREEADGGPGLLKYAESLLERVRKGEDFSALAVTFSTGNKAAEGGDWGWVETSMLRKEIVDALADLEPGGTSGVIETDEQVYLLRLEGRRAGGVLAFSEAQKDIEKELRRLAVSSAYAAWIGRLRTEAFVKIRNASLF